MIFFQRLDLSLLSQRLSLVALALMASVPFLITRHFQPLPSFSSEWWAAVLGLTAFAFTFAQKRKAFTFPQSGFIPLAFLPLIAIQGLAGIIAVPSAAILFIEYLLWASCMACLGAHISASGGLESLAKAIAWGLFIGGVANACSSLIQFRQIEVSPFVVFPSINGRVYGNLGQQNHLTAQLWLAVASAVYLNLTRRLPDLLLVVSLPLLMLAAAASLSRSIALYAPLIALLAMTNPKARRLALLLPILQLSLLLLLPYLSPTPNTSQAVNPVNNQTIERLAVTSSDVRFELWRDAWNMFIDHPWLGVGVGNYARASVEYSAAKLTGLPLPAEHSHNFFMQLLAQFGLPMTIAVVVLIAIFLRDNIKQLIQTRKPEVFLSTSVLAVIGLHSQLEYPLWYTYFLGLACLFAGAIDIRTRSIAIERPRILLAVVLLTGVTLLVPLKQDELKIERALLWPYRSQSPPEALTEAMRQIEGIAKEASLLAPYGEIVLTTSIPPSASIASSHWQLCQSVLNFAPTGILLTQCAASARLLGKGAEAQQLDNLRAQAWSGKPR